MRQAAAFFLGLLWSLTGWAEGEWRALDASSLPPEWQKFQEQVVARPLVVADFVERRFFPFRSRPVELSGTAWFGREEGLTLNYREPRREVIRVEPTGVRVILNGGRSRDRAIPERGREVPSALLALFRLDFAELEKTFILHGRRTDGDWALRLTPRQADAAPIQRIVLGGESDEIREISIEQSAGRRIELSLSNVAYPAHLEPEERARVFP